MDQKKTLQKILIYPRCICNGVTSLLKITPMKHFLFSFFFSHYIVHCLFDLSSRIASIDPPIQNFSHFKSIMIFSHYSMQSLFNFTGMSFLRFQLRNFLSVFNQTFNQAILNWNFQDVFQLQIVHFVFNQLLSQYFSRIFINYLACSPSLKCFLYVRSRTLFFVGRQTHT